MGTLHTITAPPPSLYVAGDRPPVANAYFAVAIEAAVDLLEAREYRDLPRPERLAKAVDRTPIDPHRLIRCER